MHKLPDLLYDFDALEPHIDARTMEIHYGRHHNAYVTNLNKALEAAGGEWGEMELITLLGSLDRIPEAQRTAIRNNAGGHYNHSLFWKTLVGDGQGVPSIDLYEAMVRDFGSFESFQQTFAQAAATRFGSGWAWLTATERGLIVHSTANQDNPLIEGQGYPLLGLDVWEHAYYLRYRNRRPDYITAWWNLVNWEDVSRRFARIRQGVQERADIASGLEAGL